MNLKFLKEYDKDWTIEDNQVKLIGKYKKDFANGKIEPHKIAGHRLYSFLSMNKYVPSVISQMEMFGLVKKLNIDDGQINLLSGQVAEGEIVKTLNKIYGSSNGTTYPFTAENKGNVFETTISNMFSALPDYLTEAKHSVFSDRKRKINRIHEIKSTQRNKWKRDDYQNFVLEVVDNTLTEDNIVDNPNKDAIKEIYSHLTKKEQATFSSTEKKDIEEYIEAKHSKTLSKKTFLSLINRYGIQKWMIEGDLEHNLKPILKNTQNVKVKPKIKEKDFAMRRWSKEGEWFAPEEYIFQVSLYSFLYNMDHKKVIHPENVKGKYKTEIDVVFLDDDQMVVPKDSWFNKFNYIYKNPKPVKITKKNFARIPVEIDLHKFYKTVIKPCMKLWNQTIDQQHTQNLDYVSWAILKKAFRENGLDVDQFQNISKSLESKKVSLVKKTVKDYKHQQEENVKDKKERQELLDLFYKREDKKEEKIKQH